MSANWIDLGYGTKEDVVDKLPCGDWTLICDEDAATAGAASCWFATSLDIDEAIEIYERDGGTVSSIYSVIK